MQSGSYFKSSAYKIAQNKLSSGLHHSQGGAVLFFEQKSPTGQADLGIEEEHVQWDTAKFGTKSSESIQNQGSAKNGSRFLPCLGQVRFIFGLFQMAFGIILDTELNNRYPLDCCKLHDTLHN